MIIIFSFICLFLGLIFGRYLIISLLFFGIILIYSIIKKCKKFYLIIIFYLLGIGIYFLSYINIFQTRFIGVVIESKDNYFIFKAGLASYYVSYRDSTFEVGDLILIEGQLEKYNFTTYESQFNFNQYLANKYVYYELVDERIYKIFLSPLRVRNFLYSNLNNYSDDAKIILGKLLFNVSLSSEYSALINDNALFYLLSVSSLHIHLLNDFIKKMLSIKLKEKTSNLIVLLFTIVIFIMSNYKMSILKVSLFELIFFLNEYRFKTKLSYLKKVSLVGIIILLLNPSYSLSMGFIYSFSIPFYICLIRVGLDNKKKKHQKFYFVLLMYLFFLPLQVYQNGYFSLFGMIFSQILVPLIFPLFFLGVMGFFLPLYRITSIYGDFVYKVIRLIDKVGVNIYLGEVNIIFLLFYYLILLFFIFFMENKQNRHQKYTLLTLTTYLVFVSYPILNNFSSELDFINVGQGDSCLIRYHNVSVLVDTGGIKNKDLATETLIPFLKKKRINKLDYVFLTHLDFDHYGAFASLNENFKVLSYNQDNNFTSIEVGNIKFTNLNPSLSNEENDDSLVLYFNLGKAKILLMGDASIKVENKIMSQNERLKVDYLKVGHHGSTYSTSEEFISWCSPKEVIVSCGANNLYGHPSKRVITLLEKKKIRIRRTDLEGTICYKL